MLSVAIDRFLTPVLNVNFNAFFGVLHGVLADEFVLFLFRRSRGVYQGASFDSSVSLLLDSPVFHFVQLLSAIQV